MIKQIKLNFSVLFVMFVYKYSLLKDFSVLNTFFDFATYTVRIYWKEKAAAAAAQVQGNALAVAI